MGMEGKHMRGKKLGIALAALAVVAAGAGALLLRPGRSADLADALSGTVVSAGAAVGGGGGTVRRPGSTIPPPLGSDAPGRHRLRGWRGLPPIPIIPRRTPTKST